MRIQFALNSLLAFALTFSAPMLHAQTAPEANTSERVPASPSLASGQRSEPEAVPGPEKKEAESGTEAFRRSPSVIKLGGMLGMKPETASSAFEWLNFLVLAAAVLYALAKALPKFFRGRSEHIQRNLVEARVATEEARARLSAVESRLSKLDGEIAALRKENEEAAAAEERRTMQQAEEEKARILQAAEQEIAAASSAAERSLRAYAAEIAVDRAAAQMNISPEDDRVLIESFAGKLPAGEGRN